PFARLREAQTALKQKPWFPFKDIDEWELARWLVTSGLSQSKVDEFLRLKTKVKDGIQPSFHNNRALLEYIKHLPAGPKWTCRPFELTGDELDVNGEPKVEVVDLWYRDVLECIQELLSD
ncbi:hypothetical protein C8F01DRAFT_918651, partial [Mycena amicta]